MEYKKIFRNVLNIFGRNEASIENSTCEDKRKIEWTTGTRCADAKCSKIPMSTMFEYLVAFWLFDVRVSVEALKYITGCSFCSETIISLFADMPSFSVNNENTILPCFDINELQLNGEELTETIIRIISNGIYNDRIIAKFTKKIIRRDYLFGIEAPPMNIDVERILSAFESNQNCLNDLIKEKTIHTIRTKRLCKIINDMKTSRDGIIPADELTELINSSFLASERETSNCGEVYQVRIWMMYFEILFYEGLEFTEDMLDFISQDNYRQFTSQLNCFLSGYKKKEKDNREFLYEQIMRAYLKIHNEIAPDDVVSTLLIANLYVDMKEYAKARELLKGICNIESSKTNYNAAITLITAYEKEIKSIKVTRASLDITNPKYDELGEKIRMLGIELKSLYTKYEAEILDAMEYGKDKEMFETLYITILSKHARNEKECGNYDACYELLTNAPKDFPRDYLILRELGMLYQSKGHTYAKNNYYNPELAIETFKRGISELRKHKKSERDYKKSASTLYIPLANTYEATKQYDLAIQTINAFLSIVPEHKQALNILKKLTKNKCA